MCTTHIVLNNAYKFYLVITSHAIRTRVMTLDLLFGRNPVKALDKLSYWEFLCRPNMEHSIDITAWVRLAQAVGDG